VPFEICKDVEVSYLPKLNLLHSLMGTTDLRSVDSRLFHGTEQAWPSQSLKKGVSLTKSGQRISGNKERRVAHSCPPWMLCFDVDGCFSSEQQVHQVFWNIDLQV
jgi:hypothetical protein